MAFNVGDAFGSLGIGSIGGNLGSIGTAIALIILLAIIIGVSVYAWIFYKKFNKIIVLFGQVGNKVEEVGRTKACEISLNREGDKVFQMQKSKKIIPYPAISVKKNTYWFFLTQDGEWINVGLENFNEKLKQIGLHSLHNDMRYARSSLRASLKERYDQAGFLAKYGPVIAYTMFILITAIAFWLLFGQAQKVMDSINGAVEIARDVAEFNRQASGALVQANANSGIAPTSFLSLIRGGII